ncbi:hypothetical protein Bbelb_244050 [Branchiostoma belcheri]|nr:hypothetical protein Bbelb_244050 [Branchiostoma belcheri]
MVLDSLRVSQNIGLPQARFWTPRETVRGQGSDENVRPGSYLQQTPKHTRMCQGASVANDINTGYQARQGSEACRNLPAGNTTQGTQPLCNISAPFPQAHPCVVVSTLTGCGNSRFYRRPTREVCTLKDELKVSLPRKSAKVYSGQPFGSRARTVNYQCNPLATVWLPDTDVRLMVPLSTFPVDDISTKKPKQNFLSCV